MLPTWISLALSRHSSLLSIVPGKSSRLYPVSAQSCCILLLAGRPTFARPCEGVHGSNSLMSSSLLHQQCPTFLFHLTLIVFVTGGRWPYSFCFVGCCRQDMITFWQIIIESPNLKVIQSFFLLCCKKKNHKYNTNLYFLFH